MKVCKRKEVYGKELERKNERGVCMRIELIKASTVYNIVKK